ncbi:hypothetical protein DK389_13115 [Methylobacterium durans]|uniref:Uncharacterized protein n=1 Tax=Methylobacterium durans TaxID=2202825 RepID=A0A2U8W597_9HYPH|nr:hypothetical protein DK389_13115 [Methylobacterium durans]
MLPAQVEVRKLHLSRRPRWPPQSPPKRSRKLHLVRGRYHAASNLAAFSQRCHLLHDQPEHQRQRWLTLFRHKVDCT